MSKNRVKYPTNPLIGYLNINSLRNKIIDVREVIGKVSLDYFVISETKLHESFPSAQFNISNYEIRNRRDRDKNGGGLIEIVRKGFITKRLKDYETQICETICSEFTVSKKKWICFSVYRPPSYNNLIIFFEELTKSVCKSLNTYDNIIVMGDFNIDINKNEAIGHDKLDVFCNTLNLTNLVKSDTCFTNNHKSTIDLFLTNKPRSFQFTSVTETGLSDYHRLITTFMKSYFSRLKPKIIHYRNFKRFDEQKFIDDVKNADFSFETDDPNENYSALTNTFSLIVEKHAPLKKKIVRGNHAPFITKDLRKAIYTRSRLKSKYIKNPSEVNEKLYKRQRNKCVSIRKKSMKQYFSNITSKGTVTNTEFWKTMKPFLTNKGCLDNSDIMLRGDNEMITDDKRLAKLFNEHYINIIERSSGLKPEKTVCQNEDFDKKMVLHNIIRKYENHSSITKIKNSMPVKNHLSSNNTLASVRQVTSDEVNLILKSLNAKKASGTDKIPTKLVKLASNYLSKPLATAINNSLTSSKFPDLAKVANVIPIDKKADDKYDISNFRPVCLLNCFSKVYENIIKCRLTNSMYNNISPFISGYRKNYNTQHVMIRLLEEWRENLDKNYVVGGVLMDLSKAFDCIPHDLLLAKLAAYGVDENLLCYIYSYLLNRKQCVRINNINSDFLNVVSGVPQESIVGPILFNCFFSDFFYLIETANAHNFTDDNTLSAFANNIKNLIHLLESECSVAIKWFKDNKMIVNPGKFQAIILDKKKNNHTQEIIKIGKNDVKVKSSVKFLGVQIDSELNFNLHIANICRSAANQLNALIRLKHFLGFQEKKVLINSYFYSNFNYCPLVWMFSHAKSLKKVEALQKRALRFLYDDYNSP